MSAIIAVIAFILALGLLVTFHEYGHFIFARKLGVKVLRFSFGFGKPLYKHLGKDGVEYVISALPLGGYVKMLDEREGAVPEPLLPFAFNRQPLYKRALIVFAGPLFNFILAIFVFWMMFLIGIKGLAPIVGEVTPHSIADKAHLVSMTEILKVDDEPTATWQQVLGELISHIGDDTVKLTVQEADESFSRELTLDLTEWHLTNKEENPLASLGIKPFTPAIPAVIAKVVPGEAAEAAGFKPQDKVVAVNGNPIEYWHEFVSWIQKHPNQPSQIQVERDRRLVTLTATPTARETDGKVTGHLGLFVQTAKLPKKWLHVEQYGFVKGFKKGVERTFHDVVLTFKLVGKLITGKLGVETLSGPISIAEGAGASAQIGLAYYLSFLGLLSVSLGVLNLLPIPVLDGGHLLFFAVEAIIRRPISERVTLWVTQVGMFLLLLLMSIAFYNDIARLL